MFQIVRLICRMCDNSRKAQVETGKFLPHTDWYKCPTCKGWTEHDVEDPDV